MIGELSVPSRWLARLFPLIILLLFISLCPAPLSGSLVAVYLRQGAWLCFAVLGVGLMYLMGDVNLAAGGQVYFGYSLQYFLMAGYGFSFPVGALLATGGGLALGVLYSWLRNSLGVKPIFYTIAFQIILLGLSGLLMNAGLAHPARVSLERAPDSVVAWLVSWVLLMGLVWVLLSYTTVGRCLSVFRAMIQDRTKRAVADRVATFSLVTGCLLISLSSVFLFGRMGGANLSLTPGYSYDVLAGVFLGGIGTSRARSLLPQAILGSLSVVMLDAVLLFVGASTSVDMLVKGGVILLGCYVTDFRQTT